MEEHSGLRALIERFVFYRVRADIHPTGKCDNYAVGLTIIQFYYSSRYGSAHYFPNVAKADDFPNIGESDSFPDFDFHRYTSSNGVHAILPCVLTNNGIAILQAIPYLLSAVSDVLLSSVTEL